MTYYESIMQGLNEAVDYANGKTEGVRVHKVEVKPVPSFNAGDIKTIRGTLGMTQMIFASMLGVSKKTVEAWEEGINAPNGPSCRLLAMFRENPETAKTIVMQL